MHIFIVRHGQARSNVSNGDSIPFDPFFEEYEGRDPSLTPLGEMQASMTGFRLRNFKLDAIYSSPLHRAVSTAAAIAKMQYNDMPVTLMPDLVEHGTYGGDFHMIPQSMLRKIYKNIIDPGEQTLTGGPRVIIDDSQEERWRRANRVVDYIKGKYTGNENVVLVSSGAFMGENLVSAFLGMSYDQSRNCVFGSDNACITSLHFRDGKIIVNAINAVEQQGEAKSLEYLEY